LRAKFGDLTVRGLQLGLQSLHLTVGNVGTPSPERFIQNLKSGVVESDHADEDALVLIFPGFGYQYTGLDQASKRPVRLVARPGSFTEGEQFRIH
jgi:hypothetical protein